MAYCVTSGLMDATVKSAAWKTLASTSTSMFISISGGKNNFSPLNHLLWGILDWLVIRDLVLVGLSNTFISIYLCFKKNYKLRPLVLFIE